jgi:hypothetical protein
LISKSASLPSGPSVLTKKRPSRRKKRDVTPSLRNVALPKLPWTVSGRAGSIACACCAPASARCSAAWHSPQAASATIVGAAGAPRPIRPSTA